MTATGIEKLKLRPLEPEDPSRLPTLAEVLERYLVDQASGRRWVRVAELGTDIAGYITLLRVPDDPVLRDADVPEISDLRVFEPFRRRGVGTALLDAVEAEAADSAPLVGLNVGLHSGYGSAQRLYVRRGYLPDGRGAVVEGETVAEGSTIRLDDDPIVTLRMLKQLGSPHLDRHPAGGAMAPRFEYKFIRLGEGLLYVSKDAQATYQEVVTEHAKDGWRLIQIFAPPIGGAGSGTAKFFELILERPIPGSS